MLILLTAALLLASASCYATAWAIERRARRIVRDTGAYSWALSPTIFREVQYADLNSPGGPDSPIVFDFEAAPEASYNHLTPVWAIATLRDIQELPDA
jgi:hypothetical protein